jgi:hypothetical protein
MMSRERIDNEITVGFSCRERGFQQPKKSTSFSARGIFHVRSGLVVELTSTTSSMHLTSSSTFLGKLPLPDSLVLDGNDCGGGAARGDVDVALAAPAEP